MLDGATGDALSGMKVEDVLGLVRPGPFPVDAREYRLSAPSYEQHPAGVAFGAGGVTVPEDEAVAAPEGHETEVWEPATGQGPRPGVLVRRPPVEMTWYVGHGAGRRDLAGVAGRRRAGGGGRPTGYVVVDAATGLPDPGDDVLTPARAVPRHGRGVP